MKIRILLFISFFTFIICGSSYSQIIVESKAKIQNVDFKLVNDQLVITYDLVNTKPGERFNISVKIFTKGGKEIDAQAYSGDVNSDVSGGYKKKIIWDIEKDIAYIEDEIIVRVLAELQNPKIIKPTSKGTALLLSTLYPGWGSSKITQKNVHVLKGLLAYGCVAGAVVYNYKAYDNYEKYKNTFDAEEADEDNDGKITAGELNNYVTASDKLFKDAENQRMISEVFLYSAVAVWALEYLNILLAKNRTRTTAGLNNNISIDYAYNKIANTPMVTLKINF